MSTIPASVTRLLEESNRLPGVGPKPASRLTYYLLRVPDEDRAAAYHQFVTELKMVAAEL